MTDLLAADRLTRAFGDRVAVRNLSLNVQAGEIVALLGPNGAGKTTTMRMLAGLILPDAGIITIAGTAVSRDTADQARRSIGLLTETPGLWERLTVRANLLTYARLHELDDPDSQVTRVLDQVGLADRAGDLAGKLSKGLKQRAAIARALIHRPPVVLLDEPTSGLDPASARHVRDLIGELRRDRRAVLVSTHNLSEAEQLADRIAVLKTELLAFDTPAVLRTGGEGIEVSIEFEDGSRHLATVKQLSEVADLVQRLVLEGRRVVRVSPGRRSLEDVYLSLVGAEP
ncbi:MAG TPA: ABC transporter ATP-binding protein [Vicinamibacterales bacterium]